MTRVAAIGEGHVLEGFGLAGVEVHAGEDRSGWIAAWDDLDSGVGMLLLTEASHGAVADRLAERTDLLWAVVG